jgi:2-dehydro-3-deoxygluconokinase
MKIACIGECMIELTQVSEGQLARGYGGDTLNTAVYLARLGSYVDYISALGDDPWSDEMIAGWRAEGVGTDHVARVSGKLPGLYMIETGADGERRFFIGGKVRPPGCFLPYRKQRRSWKRCRVTIWSIFPA